MIHRLCCHPIFLKHPILSRLNSMSSFPPIFQIFLWFYTKLLLIISIIYFTLKYYFSIAWNLIFIFLNIVSYCYVKTNFKYFFLLISIFWIIQNLVFIFFFYYCGKKYIFHFGPKFFILAQNICNILKHMIK